MKDIIEKINEAKSKKWFNWRLVANDLDNDTKDPYIVQSIIDLDGNGKYEVIVSKGTSNFATFNNIYL